MVLVISFNNSTGSNSIDDELFEIIRWNSEVCVLYLWLLSMWCRCNSYEKKRTVCYTIYNIHSDDLNDERLCAHFKTILKTLWTRCKERRENGKWMSLGRAVYDDCTFSFTWVFILSLISSFVPLLIINFPQWIVPFSVQHHFRSFLHINITSHQHTNKWTSIEIP